MVLANGRARGGTVPQRPELWARIIQLVIRSMITMFNVLRNQLELEQGWLDGVDEEWDVASSDPPAQPQPQPRSSQDRGCQCDFIDPEGLE